MVKSPINTVSNISTYRYDDGMKHLVLDFPQYGTWQTLCGIADCCGNQRRGKPLRHGVDCPDCDYALQQIRLHLTTTENQNR
ncbi:hypothetical protein KG918_003482 [Salmonella enterica]|uniref:hypothetical protein n=1 Tax=Salmonella enterica TaxID=28901 RepID=UPI000B54560E|nr:hypothetical protein [Salmonella enterica]EDT8784859.1 hypothetical protein [Salmonella enterica subsp. diarizonae]ASG84207.1 hypothetical protein LFZ55_15440 [Salmonella enterica subsp. diarizonae serovar 65:c:z str. SA20044251]EEA3739349.1 hypothetical protein [Salmonella enterica]EEE1922315.1 hypothetical protein [Salmonella enterica subsp. diarizonae]EEF4030861.1 hypothetical protein [Salmonella enterica]